jgi:SAM-dependent methyltransferase
MRRVRTPPLALTGERTVPGLPSENYWFRRHEAAYADIADRLTARYAGRDARVLDAGCGEGYGAALLGGRLGAQVAGLDYDGDTVAHARHTYDLPVARANLVAMPLGTGTVDLIVASQVIEHLWEPERFVAECARVLAPGGTLVVTTPNRRTFPPGNPYHFRELDAAELVDVLAAHVDGVDMLGVRHGPRLTEWERDHGSLVDAQLAADPADWSPAVSAAVAAVTAADFEVGSRDIADCLDLVAIARTQTQTHARNRTRA